MKRIALTLMFGLALLIQWPVTSFAQHEEHPAAAAGAAEHEATPPLLPTNAHEAEEYFLTPAIWTLVIFVVMLAILYPTAWKKVLAGLKAREKRIRDDIANAEAARAKAEATLKEYNVKLSAAEDRIRQMLSQATVDGEKIATNIRMKAQQDSEEIKERAQKDIESAKNSAISEIYSQAAELSTSIAAKILKRNLNPDDQKDLVKESLAQLQGSAAATGSK
ncbi:MAG TPA: F0F1 ATP synthase subunit B [Tepidisphaeraceae bacterium]|jgi:F-type H+-transporting ATPase subunit b